SPHSPYLHSFPTRRSSDLVSRRFANQRRRNSAGLVRRERQLRPRLSALRLSGRWPQSDAAAKRANGVSTARTSREGQLLDLSLRSEEHTSELQSRSDLVCR